MSVPDETPKLDISRPHPARRYNFWLGGKDNFQADRDSGDAIAHDYPQVIVDALANRQFMNRAVHYLAAEAGVTQFLDIGAGLPVHPNVHDTAQAANPACRVVYVDNDPMVMAHARALLTGTPLSTIAYVEADMHDTGRMLAEGKKILDFDQPIAVLLIAVLHFVEYNDQAHEIVNRLVDAVPPGSFLVVTNFTTDGIDEAAKQTIEQRLGHGQDGPFRPRSRAEFEQFFDRPDLTLVDPGICSVAKWRPDPGAGHWYSAVFAGVARKDA
jgi:hypothetical protein